MKFISGTKPHVVSDSIGKIEIGDTLAAKGQFWLVVSVSNQGIYLRDDYYEDREPDNTHFLTAAEVDNLHI